MRASRLSRCVSGKKFDGKAVKYRWLIVSFVGAGACIYGKVGIVAFRVRNDPLFTDFGLLFEIQPCEAHISCGGKLHEKPLRQLKAVRNETGRGGLGKAVGFHAEIAHSSGADGGKFRLHDASRIVQREMQVSAENDGLRILRQNIRKLLPSPMRRRQARFRRLYPQSWDVS